jgi:hypothetical protein
MADKKTILAFNKTMSPIKPLGPKDKTIFAGNKKSVEDKLKKEKLLRMEKKSETALVDIHKKYGGSKKPESNVGAQAKLDKKTQELQDKMSNYAQPRSNSLRRGLIDGEPPKSLPKPAILKCLPLVNLASGFKLDVSVGSFGLPKIGLPKVSLAQGPRLKMSLGVPKISLSIPKLPDLKKLKDLKLGDINLSMKLKGGIGKINLPDIKIPIPSLDLNFAFGGLQLPSLANLGLPKIKC